MMNRIILILLSCSCLSWAASPTFVRKGFGQAVAGTVAVTTTTTAGNLGVVICSFAQATGTPAVSDGGTDTLTAIPGSLLHSTSEGATSQVFYVQSLAGGSKTFTCTNPANLFSNVWYYEYSGQNASALDTSGTSDSTGGNSATPPITVTVAANTVLVGAVGCGNTCSAGTCTPSACTNSQSDGNGDISEDQASTAGGSVTLKAAQTIGTYAWSAASFKGAGGGAVVRHRAQVVQ